MTRMKQVKDSAADNGWLVFAGPVKVYKNEWGEVEEVDGDEVGSYWKSPWKSEWLAKHHGRLAFFGPAKMQSSGHLMDHPALCQDKNLLCSSLSNTLTNAKVTI